MASLDNGKYIIINCKYKNIAILPDSNCNSGIIASNQENVPGEIVRYSPMDVDP